MKNARTNTTVDALLQKRRALDERINRLKQRDAATQRKSRSRALLLIGVAVEKQVVQNPNSAGFFRQLIAKHLQPREQTAVLDNIFPGEQQADPAES